MKDPVAFDYSYDSGEEWEEEPDDAEEVLSSAGSEEEDAGSGEEELDDWLVEDNEVEYEPGAIPDPPSRSLSPPLPNGGKRKLEVEKEKEKDSKKRRIVKALVPYTTGPHWENSMGDCQDHLRNYRIQLLNGTKRKCLLLARLADASFATRHTLSHRSIHLHIGGHYGFSARSSRSAEIRKTHNTRRLCYSSFTSTSASLFSDQLTDANANNRRPTC